jgi:SAM-dependent methyltransferase
MDSLYRKLLLREGEKFRPSLENKVAHQHEREISLLTVWMDRERNNNILRIVKEEIDRLRACDTNEIRILDIGCAYGNHIFMLNARNGGGRDIRFNGVDIDPNALEFAKSFSEAIPGYDNCVFSEGDAEAGLEFGDETFHIALCSDVLEHSRDLPAAMKEIARTLTPGGKMVFTSPLKNSVFKTASKILSAISFGKLERKYYDGGTKPGVGKTDKPEHGFGHISEMNLKGYLRAGSEAGLSPAEIIPASVFSGSMFFDRHPVLLACLVFIEAIHRALRFVSWAHGVQIVFVKKNSIHS